MKKVREIKKEVEKTHPSAFHMEFLLYTLKVKQDNHIHTTSTLEVGNKTYCTM